MLIPLIILWVLYLSESIIRKNTETIFILLIPTIYLVREVIDLRNCK